MTEFEKFDFNDVAALIIIKIDSEERFINLDIIIKFLKTNFKIRIFILEVGETQFLDNISLSKIGVNYEFIFDTNPIFHMTKYRNYLVEKCIEKIIIHYDSDIIVEPKGIRDIVEGIRRNEIDFGYPYDGRFYNVPLWYKKIFYKSGDLNILRKYTSCLPLAFPNSLGGIFISNKSFYFNIGMENEQIIGWGPDDKERFYKSVKSGGRYKRADSPLYHLYHPILQYSKPSNESTLMENTKQYLKSIYK